ncbi:MAG: hypothetical protein LBR08_01605 [Bacteroidales bacterium]|jgi:hypothetical protein|nr:hypothetical protein [Bacteroidales bacterium]
MNFKKLLICFVSLSGVSAAVYLIACGRSVDEDMSYTGYFRRDIPERNNYYYSFSNLYDNAADRQTDREENIREWKRHLGGSITDSDAGELIYEIPLGELQSIREKARRGQWNRIDRQWFKNSMMQRMMQRNDLSSLNYLLYAKACEQQAGRRSEEWDAAVFDPVRQDSLLHVGLALHRSAKTEFIRLRCGFQVVRMAFYCGRKDDCVNYYRKMMAPSENTPALAVLWALSFYAGAVPSETEALYACSKVFDRCPRYSQSAMNSYRRIIRQADTSGLAALCANRRERSVIEAMTGFTCFHSTLEPLQRVYNLYSSSPYIETLLVREVNKVEAGLHGADSSAVLAHARELGETAVRYAGLRSVRRPALWYTAAAYLSFLSGDFEQASLLASIAEEEPADAKIREQLLAVKLLVHTDMTPFDDATETRILPSLQWLLDCVRDSTRSAESRLFFDRTAAHYFGEKLPGIYLKRQQPVKAAWCAGIAKRYSSVAAGMYHLPDALTLLDRHADVDCLEEALRQMSAPQTMSACDSFLYRFSPLTESAVLELQGTKHLRALRFGAAADCFERLSDASGLFHLQRDPFELPSAFNRQGEKNKDDREITFHSKLSFAREMADLQHRVRQRKPLAEDLFRYACGLLQMSYYGNSWQLLSYRWTWLDRAEWITVQPSDEFYHYYRTDLARDCFMQALERSRNREFQAQCLFFASWCSQMNSPGAYVLNNARYTAGKYLLDNPYFARLKKNFSKTFFYGEAVTRCSYLADFAKGNQAPGNVK